MTWGLQNRLSRIIRPTDGHTVMLAADHGYFLGPTHKLEIPRKTLEPLLPYADAVMVTRGVVRTSIDPGANVPIVLRVSGGASVLNEDLSNEKITTSMKEAVRLNVSAVALSIFVGAAHEHDSLVNLGKLVDEGEEAGMPVLAVTAVGKELEKRDARYLGLACRIASEFGAHFVKTYYAEDFSKVVESCPVPLVVAGGPKLETELDALELAYDAIQDGAKGVDMGRNIWQSTNPVGMIRGIRAVVHERATRRKPSSSSRARSRRSRRRTMRAAMYYANDDVRIVDVPKPHIGPGEILVHVKASGICGSDVMEWYRKPKAPLVLGHEIAAEVAQVGAGVDTVKGGDRVFVSHHLPCGAGRYCRAGHETASDTVRTTDLDPGDFADLVGAHAINVSHAV